MSIKLLKVTDEYIYFKIVSETSTFGTYASSRYRVMHHMDINLNFKGLSEGRGWVFESSTISDWIKYNPKELITLEELIKIDKNT